MSQFEFVSIAFALAYTLAIGRVLAGASEAFDGQQRYLIHALWLVHILLSCVAQWWLRHLRV